MRLTEEEYRALTGAPEKKRSKYHNKKLEVAGETFDSRREYDYYLILKDREKRGEIKDLKRQVPIEIQRAFIDKVDKKHRAITYVADFTYYDLKDYQTHYIDVKGFRTEVYKIKKKLLAYRNIIIEEV